jgi:TPR repeat protein
MVPYKPGAEVALSRDVVLDARSILVTEGPRERLETLAQALRREDEGLDVIPGREFLSIAFTDDDATLARLLEPATCARTREALGADFVVLAGETQQYTTDEKGGMLVYAGFYGAGMSREHTTVVATIIDLERAEPLGDVSSHAQGNLAGVGAFYGLFVVPMTDSSARDGLVRGLVNAMRERAGAGSIKLTVLAAERIVPVGATPDVASGPDAPPPAGAPSASASIEFDEALVLFDAGDYTAAHRRMLGLAERGHAAAMVMVTGDLYVGRGVEPDYYAARAWGLRASAEATPADFERVLGLWRSLSESGDPLAQMVLGTWYNSGFGVAMDEAEAFRWIKRSADQGNARGQYALGTLYQHGDGTRQDFSKALELYSLAAAQGDDWAAYNLGVAYQFGRGVKKDLATAASWFRKAAERGNPGAAYDLAYLYDSGAGSIDRDYAEALKWYQVAAAKGSVLALNNLAVMYLQRKGVVRNPSLAFEYASLADSNKELVDDATYRQTMSTVLMLSTMSLDAAGQRAALFQAGMRCRDGDGVPRDDILAYRFMSRSILDEPDDELRTARIAARDELATRMHPEVLARA